MYQNYSCALWDLRRQFVRTRRQALDTAVVHHAASMPYTLTDGNDPADIAPSRTTFDVVAYQDVLQQVGAPCVCKPCPPCTPLWCCQTQPSPHSLAAPSCPGGPHGEKRTSNLRVNSLPSFYPC